MTSFLHTSLHDSHIKLGAKMLPFAGFDMPIQYKSVKEEALVVRRSAGMFDVSHMGEFFVTGKDAIRFVDYLVTNSFVSSPVGKAVYSPLCRDNGTMIDDLIAYKISNEEVLICVNAANIQKDWSWISQKLTNFDCALSNKSDDFSLIAIQGPDSQSFLQKIGFDADALSSMDYYSVKTSQLQGHKCILARTGYTGEDGFEIFADHKLIKDIWNNLLDSGVTPCGLAARDVLRLEVCYPLYGHELSDDLTPLDSGLKWTVRFEKEDFIAKNALLTTRPSKQLLKLSLEKGIPREGHIILNSSNQEIGVITSGTMSTTLEKGIAFGLVDKSLIPDDKQYFIKIRNNIFKAETHSKPFVHGGHK